MDLFPGSQCLGSTVGVTSQEFAANIRFWAKQNGGTKLLIFIREQTLDGRTRDKRPVRVGTLTGGAMPAPAHVRSRNKSAQPCPALPPIMSVRQQRDGAGGRALFQHKQFDS